MIQLIYNPKKRYSSANFLCAFFLLFPVAIFAQPTNQSFTFAVIGDAGTGKKEQFDVARQMKRTRAQSRFDTVIMLGDNIYPNGNPKDFGKKFDLPYADLLSVGVKFYASLGNHDVRSGAAAHINYPKFNMGGRRYYSFQQANGLVEFFALDSTAMDAEQKAWLEKALQTSTARWKIAFFHHPLYSSGKRHGSDENLRVMLEPMFVRFGVNVVFSGHDHVYEHIQPQKGIQYFVEGASGALRKNNLHKKSKLTAVGNDLMRSFLLVEINQAEMQVTTIGEDGSSLDRVKIALNTKTP